MEKQPSSAISVRVQHLAKPQSAGLRRHVLRLGPQPSYIDSERTNLNSSIIQPLVASDLRTICEGRRDQRSLRKMALTAAVDTTVIITFGSAAQIEFNGLAVEIQDRAYLAVAARIASELGTDLTGLTAHRDESAPHAHAQMPAVARDGHPLSKKITPRVAARLQDFAAEEIAKFAPKIVRGISKSQRIEAEGMTANVIHKSVHELHRTIPADLVAKRLEFEEAARAVAEKKASYDEMHERVVTLEMKAELGGKELKRLEVYRHRVENRLKELEAALQASESARIEVDRLSKISLDDATTMQVKTETVREALESLVYEVANQTIGRNPTGNIRAKDLDKLKAALPDIAPAVRAAADLTDAMRSAAAVVEKDRAEVSEEKAAIEKNWVDILASEKEIRAEKRSLEVWTRDLFKNTIIIAQHLKLPMPPGLMDGLKSLQALAVRIMNQNPTRSERPEPPTSDGPGF